MKRVAILCCLLCALGGLALTLAGLQHWDKLARDTLPLELETEYSFEVLAQDEQLLRPFLTSAGLWRLPVALEAVDPRLLTLLAAYEDKRFLSHDGVDRRALLRAGWQLVRHGRIISGASTLTMQVVRLVEDGHTRSLDGKIKQIIQARRLEQRLSKSDILALYLNHAPYGGNLEGVRAASWAYFGKEPTWLNLSEIALLIALPQSPEGRRPDENLEAARRARDMVLERLLQAGAISQDEVATAMAAPMPTRRKPFPMTAPHQAKALYAASKGKTQRVISHLDAELQRSLETHVAEKARALGRSYSIAALVVEHETGRVRAAVSGAGLLSDQQAGFVNMLKAVRSPGSTLKPFIYGLAFEQGLAHPNTLIDDRPRSFDGYAPENFDTGFHGVMSLGEALRQSLNIPAVAVLDRVDPHRLSSRLRRGGAALRFPKEAAPNLAMSLGGVGLTLEDLVKLYGGLARGGQTMPLIYSDNGEAHHPVRMLNGQASNLVIKALYRKSDQHQVQRRDLIYKTGTAYGYRDAWTIGFDGKYVVGIWVGRPDGAPAGDITGATAALPLFFDVFARLGTKPHPARDVTLVSNADLPPHLQFFDRRSYGSTASVAGLEIAFPPENANLLMSSGRRDVSLKVRGGAPPFTWLANGQPVQIGALRRETAFEPDGPGFTTLTVIDANGARDSVAIRLTR